MCVSREDFQKHLGIYLDEKLNFSHHIKEKITKAMKGVGVIKILSKMLPQHSLLTIYKSFVRPHLDYGDILYDQSKLLSLDSGSENCVCFTRLKKLAYQNMCSI